MSQLHPVPALAQQVAQALDQGNRAVTSSGTADGQSEIGTPLALVERQGEVEQPEEAFDELASLGPFEDEAGHLGMASVELAQPADEVRIDEEARVEHEVGVGGHAILV